MKIKKETIEKLEKFCKNKNIDINLFLQKSLNFFDQSKNYFNNFFYYDLLKK